MPFEQLREAIISDPYNRKKWGKWIIICIAILISLFSILFTHDLMKQIRLREKAQIELYAHTLEYVANASEITDMHFIFEEIIQTNQAIPVILADENHQPFDSKNVDFPKTIVDENKKKNFLIQKINEMALEYDPIEIQLKTPEGDIYGKQYVYYQHSQILHQLKYYPYAQLAIIFVFVVLIYVAINFSRRAEQNLLWVGLAKETAHQLGTPLSSLMAWADYFKQTKTYSDDELEEMNKDIERLTVVTTRFSSIGSKPQLQIENVTQQIEETLRYLKSRLSSKIKIDIFSAIPQAKVALNKDLFSWVIENLIKNAVDAMDGSGHIQIDIAKNYDGLITIDVADNGKGIPKKDKRKVFVAGYSTKKRGWGLGLALSKRIIQQYHKGKIIVAHTEEGKGTTFRIFLSEFV